jgi:alkylation response protein AidB-like acyl-CoA dehydrogenase
MTFEIPEDLNAFATSIRKLALAELAPCALETAQQASFPRQSARLFAARGLMGLVSGNVVSSKPKGVLAGVLAVEATARICPRSADALHQGNFGAALLLARYATTEEHRKQLSGILAGERLVAIAISEENAGAQASALASRARMQDDAVVLNGSKKFTANSEDADGFVVYAGFGESVADIGAAFVDRNCPGLTYGEAIAFMSGERWRPLTFKNVEVSPSAVLFNSGGFTDKATFFDVEKIGNAARALGVGWCAFDLAREHALHRVQFGRSIAEFQGLQWKIAEARLGLEAAQLTLYRAASRADRHALRGEDSSCAKVLCNRAAMAACDATVQVLGGAGYSQDGLAEYCFRKARGHMINGGVVELMMNRIAEGIFDRKFPQHAI